ncbi:MAG: helix-hairpin-helix domain-containing protein [Bacteroidales bacterium]|nr:helix-hairpin-helix domain-containing protein [Bacteroidales bacterium]
MRFSLPKNIPSVFVLAFLLSAGFNGAFAQVPEAPDTLQPPPVNEELFQQRIESLAEEAEEELDYSELIEELEVFLRNPINLNFASADDLRRLFFLNDIQINNLLNHISMFGRLLSIYELQSVEGFDLETIQLLQPYVTVAEERFRRHFRLDDMLREGNSQFFLRYQQLLEEQRGFSPIDPEELEANPNARYLGSPFRLYSRYRFTYYNNISIGMTAEKDPGEEFFRGTQPNGFDYYSGHVYVRDFGRLRAAVVGDFQVQFGQGLTLWSGLAFGKSGEAVDVKKNGLGLRPYTSVDENNFMRGTGVTVGFGDFELTGFFSSKGRDANVLEMDTVTGEALVITSLQQTGLHRTPRELENKNAVHESVYGGHLAWKRNNLSLGATAYRMELGAEFQRNLSFYNQFDFNDRTNTNFGFDYNYISRNFNFFGEAAMSENGGYAFLNGVMMSLDPRLSLALLHRKFSKDYQSLFAAAFSENTRVVNEDGLYLGINARLSQQWRISAYADHFSFPWMKFRTYLPSKGYEYLVQVNYRPSRGTEMYARYRIKNKPLNSQDPDMMRHLEDVVRQNYRFHISYPISPSFTLRNRIELVDFRFGERKEKGYAIYQDVIYRSLSSPLAVTLRYALFDTDGFDSRIYVYENDVLYAFSFPFYADRGSRAYVLVRYRLSRNIDLYARLAQTWYSNRDSSGSGLDLIEGNTRTEIKAQMRIRF